MSKVTIHRKVPGLLKDWVCIIDPTVPMPYFYNETTNESKWEFPKDPKFINNSKNKITTEEQKNQLVKLLLQRKEFVEQSTRSSATSNEATATTTATSNVPVVGRNLFKDLTKDTSLEPIPNSPEAPPLITSLPSQPPQPSEIPIFSSNELLDKKRSQSNHPLQVARVKLHSNLINDEEYKHIVQTHQMMEKEQRTIILEGELMKMGKRMGRFVKRWFVLYSDLQLHSCRAFEHRLKPTSVIDLSKCIVLPVDLSSEKKSSHCLEITEIHSDLKHVLAAPTVSIQIKWLEAMLNVKQKTLGMGRLNVIKANAALKQIKRKARMPSM